jgi:Domain of unknown function (DUF4148)
MNSKYLYAATVALSLLSTLAFAQEAAPLTRAQVNAETQQAIASGTIRRTDYDQDFYRPQTTDHSTVTRAQVDTALAQDNLARKALVGPEADRNYNPDGTAALETSTLARSTVRNEVLAAAANGTLQRTDYDDPALLARRANEHVAGTHLAQRIKARFAKSQG